MQNNLTSDQIKDMVQWDVKNWKNVLSFWEAHFVFKPNQKALVLGDRTGGLSLFFALKGFEVVCSDYVDDLSDAKMLHIKYGVDQKVSYHKIDMRKIPFDDEMFDVVSFKSVLGALNKSDEHNQTIEEIHRVLKKDGALLFAENTKATKFHQWMRRKFANWKDPWTYLSDSEFNFWAQKFSSSKTKKAGFFALFGRNEKQRNLIGFFDRIFNPITPKKWKYILFGVFVK